MGSNYLLLVHETYLINVSLYPLQQLALILQTVIQTERLIGYNLFAGEKTIWSNTVIEVDHNHLLFGGSD